ncbi:hypothetical protein CHS0354_002262 [Potamilus streckersoni]|uniref:Uncharacterized protein n=1 Tax=Potamilus streckersoni TaxID=2493646 RepID=A0AAE0S3P9_9BIVA|nr:hypothetical protein CHS0354_002262 [Potamilus streckersoni]
MWLNACTGKKIIMRGLFGENLCGTRWNWLLLLAIWIVEACSVQTIIPNTTKPTNVMTSRTVDYTKSNNLPDPLQSPSTNDNPVEGLKGGLPFWLIPSIIGGTIATLILVICMVVCCPGMIPFKRKSPVRSRRDYNKYTFHRHECRGVTNI